MKFKETNDGPVFNINVSGENLNISRPTPNSTDTTTIMTLKSNGEVGIGTTLRLESDGHVKISNNLTVTGNFRVDGETTTVNSTTVTIDDTIFTLGGDSEPVSNDGKDRGIEFRYHDGTNPKLGFMGYDNSTGNFTMLTAATNSSEIFSGTKATLVANLEGTADSWSSYRTLTLAGDVTGSVSINGSEDVTLTVAANSVALGTDTTGNYVKTGATSGLGISGHVDSAEGGTFTVTSNATTSSSANTIVLRDSDSNITATNITAMQTKLSTIAVNANNYTYTLPEASSSTRGGIKIGYPTSGKKYGVELYAGKAYVNVPWVDTNTVTTNTNRSDASIKTAVGGWYYSSNWCRNTSYAVYITKSDPESWSGTWFKKEGWVGSGNFSASDVGLEVVQGILGEWIAAYSDRRIKKNIEDVPDNKSLELLRIIPVRYYHYKDPAKRRERVIGFIAQEIRAVFPEAVHISPNEQRIPTILKNITNPVWEEKINEISENEWLLTHFDLIDNSGVVHTIDIEQETIYVFVVQTTKPSLQTTTLKNMTELLELIPDDNGHFLFKEKYEKCYLYGTKVNDFHCVDKQKLYALSFSATQEIDRIQQEEKTKLAAAETNLEEQTSKLAAVETNLEEQTSKLEAAEAEIATLKTTLTNVLARLAALELN